MLKIFGLALLGAIMAFVLKAFGWRGAPIVAVSVMIALLSVLFDRFDAPSSLFETLGAVEGMEKVTECVLKILGIGYLSGICSDVCRELGENGIASVVSTVARIEMLIVISPMMLEILTLGLELVGE